MRLSLHIFDALLFGLVASGVAAGLTLALESVHNGAARAYTAVFTSPGAALMKPFGYSAFSWFGRLTHSDGPGSAYLQMFVLSGFLWAIVFAGAFCVCRHHFQQRRLNTR